VACFFERPWSRLSPNLSKPAQAWLLGTTAFYLRALGRLTEALEPMRAGLERVIEAENWEQAASGVASRAQSQTANPKSKIPTAKPPARTSSSVPRKRWSGSRERPPASTAPRPAASRFPYPDEVG